MAVRDNPGRVLSSLRVNLLPALLAVLGLVLLLDLGRRLVIGGLTLSALVRFLWTGLVRGMAIGLAGIGLSLTYSILGFANFAHGDYITVGAFAGWVTTFVVAGVGSVGLDLLVLVSSDASAGELGINVLSTPVAIAAGLVVAAGITALVTVALDRVVFRPMRDANGIALLIASVGVALALRYTLLILFSGSVRTLTTDVPTTAVGVGSGEVVFRAHDVTVVVLAGLLMLGTHLLLQYTKLGTAMRAMADNKELALVTGIPTERVVRTTWILGGALTGAAGFLIALQLGGMSTTLGWDRLLLVFAAVILGGVGSIYGAIVGGLIIGITIRLSLVWLPNELSIASAFVVLVFMLLVRPNGLLGGVETV
jgi:branched-chain amino acid transport system permease protein